ncbi:uncharacterized protein LOC119609892 [Lucilia sericata]|uniref:uncharacterized protein LOC119609892 n=1 Tax=Lucilia sericata TaxID=13632 RepID=UPI0018A7EBE2|nr:uncharacterized protein LOC119609892 [Lucilia sericata]
MKSVKNFFIERLHSVDNSEQTNSGSCKTKEKTTTSSKSTDGNSTPSANSVSGEESPSNPSLSAQTPSHEGVNSNVTSPTTDLSADKTISCPFDFSPTATTAAVALATNQKQKNRRKISLPWGRQSSIAKNLGLARQHTIDTPSSFRIFRQSSSKLKVCLLHYCF